MFIDMAKMGNGEAASGMVPVPTPDPPEPVSNFTIPGDPPSGIVPLTVTFEDTSTDFPPDLPRSWLWDFGDGGSSTDQNPTHTYTVPGTYDVTLTVTDPAGSDSSTQPGCVSALSAMTLTRRGTVAVGTAPEGICGSGNYVYVGADGTGGAPSFYVVDVSDPDHPTVVTSLVVDAIGDTNLWQMRIIGNSVLAICDLTQTLYIINITTPAAPTLRSYVEYFIPGTNCLYVEGNTAYISGLQWINIIDITNLDAPTLINQYTPLTTFASFDGISKFGTSLHVVEWGALPEDPETFRVFDVTDLLNPVEGAIVAIPVVSDPSTPDVIREIIRQGNYVYLTHDGAPGMSVMDVTIPTAPVAVATLPIEPTAYGSPVIALQNTFAFIPVSNFALATCNVYAVNIATPTAPVIVDSLAVDQACYGIFMGSRYGYCTSITSNTLVVFDTVAP